MNNKNVLSAQDVIDEIQDLDGGFSMIEDPEENQKSFYNKQQTVLEFASNLTQDELIQVVEYFAEMQSSYTAAPLLQLLTQESKTKLIDSSGSFDLNVALIGEYGSHHWIEALKTHTPEIVTRRVEWALKAVEEDLLNYKEMKDKMPKELLSSEVLTYRVKTQEKVLSSFQDFLTFRQLERYMESVSSVQRAPYRQLQTCYEEKKVAHEQGVFEKDIADICEQRAASGQVIVSRKNYKI